MPTESLQALVRDCVRAAIAETGRPVPPLEAETALFGSGDALLDSLGLVSLVADLEGRLAAEHRVEVVLADERAMSRTRSPFRTVATLEAHVAAAVAAASASS